MKFQPLTYVDCACVCMCVCVTLVCVTQIFTLQHPHYPLHMEIYTRIYDDNICAHSQLHTPMKTNRKGVIISYFATTPERRAA